MNKRQQIFLDNYEEIILTLRLRDCERENIDKMINCGNPAFGGAMYACTKCGKMHMVPNEDGFYTVTDYQVAEDGEGYASSLQEMIGDTEDLTVEMFDTDSESDFELLRGTLQFYVMGNGMDISEFVDMDGTVYSIVEE